MTTSSHDNFDRLLKAMTEGDKPSGRKSASGDQASSAASGACSSDTQTPPDTRKMLPADVNVSAVDAAL